ncbi:DUF885 domain-containing protein [Pseudonocardia lacus]|uniref:DUF885 domain-containing protein n=1 Tax=Pseudonocardia lacus TaxID=2835865 RepID=UPI001BDCFA45|nr:DUF885 domain-containing protein [Pseudonocardia lacus]
MSQGAREARQFVRLALRLDRLAPGLVGAYLGDPGLRRAVDDEPVTAPAELAARARALAVDVRAAGLPPHRREVLLAQLAAAECTARRLAGEAVPFRREVELCLGVAVGPGDEDGYRAAHRDLDALLPGRGPLADRLATYRRADELAPDRLLPGARALAAALRARVATGYGLAPDESVAFEVVPDAPWAALHQHRGPHRSAVLLNAAARARAGQLAPLVAHETYPGHHTELCRTQDGPLASGEAEHAVALVLSPCSTVSEGLADTALDAAVGPGWGTWAEGVLREVGVVRTDGELAERVDRAMQGLLRVRQDAALLLHDRRAGVDAARRHLRRWLLVDDRRADRMLAFLTHPVWRAYTTAYVEGFRLVGDHMGGAAPVARARHAALVGRPTIPALLGADRAAVARAG